MFSDTANTITTCLYSMDTNYTHALASGTTAPGAIKALYREI
jgi:hypothetical protein